MNKLVVMAVSVLMLVSCKQDKLLKHLETGLVDYERTRLVKENLINDIILEKLAIFKIDQNKYKLVLMLNKSIKREIAEKYRLGVKIEILNGDEEIKTAEMNKVKSYFRNIDFNPKLKVYNMNNYYIHNFEGDFKRLESMDLYLYKYENEVFNGAIGNRVTLKNIGL
ncbi:hypothetical protein [Bizionia paragorgiae]|uniref:Lipoprotein n=1 Tax=Bizionia paragorgiae TaxID=283786 RepID=A0A1H3W494_BIZPA|nr:hypothetical protein [Bizionia paragorgiae]SDZ81098.1 hypothetical protein SAMN04487990_102182 [Bizionia paragorgiae]